MDMFWMSQAVSVVIGFVVGMLTPPLGRWMSNRLERVQAWRDGGHPWVSPSQIKFHMLNQWSPARRLLASNVIVEFDDRAWTQTWCDADLLRDATQAIQQLGAPSGTLRALRVDDRMSDDGLKLKLTFAPSMYRDLIANINYFKQNPSRLDELMTRFNEVPTDDMIESAPPSVTSMNLTITSADGKLLATKRSAAVRTSQNLWTLGPNETMRGASPVQGGVETPHDLAIRCLRSELHLELDEVGAIEISWVGYNLAGAMVHFVGHVRSGLRSSEIEDRLRQSGSSYQVDDITWLPTTRHALKSIVESVVDRSLDGAGAMRWHPSAALAAADRWRWRSVMG